EGPSEASKLLSSLGGYSNEQIDRICYLIAHHHTYNDIDGLDYQILVESDFLVNIYEDQLLPLAIDNVRKKIFRTKSGLDLLDNMYNIIT
ncbi:MAG: phosphohydrolase, partial [Prevotella sp.]|nr:phosphohydrolase [Prevotella sp.]